MQWRRGMDSGSGHVALGRLGLYEEPPIFFPAASSRVCG